MTQRILILDSQRHATRQAVNLLEADGYEPVLVDRIAEAHDRMRSEPFPVLITEWRMADGDALSLIQALRAEHHPIGIVVVTSHGETTAAVDAMKAGADDFMTKPLDTGRFSFVVRRLVERRAMQDELAELRRERHTEFGYFDMISKSPRMRKVFDLIERVGPLRSTVLIHGETGSGKELVARAVHERSGRKGPCYAVNCAAIQESLLESELFGHERGAFTGAERQRKGRFELASGGTLFLDEISEASLAVQAKLLRVLQSGQIERLGSSQSIQVDTRIVAASNKRLEDEVIAGRFRQDLFFRLNVVRVDLPPLRDRREDIPLLAVHFLERLKAKSFPPVTEIHPEAMQALLDHTWPGNVRELENAIHAAVAMTDGAILHREALPASVVPRGQVRRTRGQSLIDITTPLPDLVQSLVDQVEREYFAQLLARYRGSIARCAEHSGLSRRSVAIKLQKHALNRAEFRISRRDERPSPSRPAPPQTDGP
jgi:DNA-binding NtrC family response regulator